MKSVDEQCQILRPDIYATGGKEVFDAWVRNIIQSMLWCFKIIVYSS